MDSQIDRALAMSVLRNVCLLVVVYAATASSLLHVLHPASSPDTQEHHKFEKWLHSFLTNSYIYDVNIRPAVNASDTVNVYFGLSLINLVNVDDKKGSITANYFMRYQWQDVRLAWNSSEHGGIEETRIPVGKLWKPDLVLYNGANGENSLTNQESLAVLSFSGGVLYLPQALLTTSCSFDMTWFPYDEHTCSIMVGSWTYDGNMLNPQFFAGMNVTATNSYIAHNEWTITANFAERNEKYYACCPEPYPDLTFTLTLKRSSSYYTQMYVVPGVILALVTPFIFALPVNKSHRYMLGASLMITSAIITSSFDGTVPMTSGTPIIGRWFTGLQTIITVALVFSAVISNLAEKSANGQHPPYWIKKIMVDTMGSLLCIERGLLHMRSTCMDEDEGHGSRSSSTEWFLVARVLDRLFFVVYCVIFLLMFILFSIK